MSTHLQAVDQLLLERDQLLADIRDRLLLAQQHHKQHYDAKHRDLHFDVGHWVWLRLHQQQALSLADNINRKLAPRYYGPYEIIERIGDVVYRLQLPPWARIHDVFHVSLLKPYHGAPLVVPPALPELQHGRITPIPCSVIRARMCDGIREILVHWDGLPSFDATWEPLEQFRRQYPFFQLEDELFVEEGRNVRRAKFGKYYTRRIKLGQSATAASEDVG